MIVVNTIDAGKQYNVIKFVDGVGEGKSPATSKNMSLEAMIKKAESVNADAIVNVRLTHSFAVLERWGASEFHVTLASGTAVKFI